jgi:RecA-family ATPase
MAKVNDYYTSGFQGINDKPLKTLSAKALLALDLPVRKALVYPWLREGESAMLYAATGAGKSMVALSMALGVAGRGKMMEYWDCPTPTKVLYVDGEMPLDDIQARMRWMLTTAGGDVETCLENLHFLARNGQERLEFVDIASDWSRDEILKIIKENDIRLVIFDNLSTLSKIENENDSSCFIEPLEFLLKLKQRGIACVLVHHANKGGLAFRGSTKLAATFEVIVRLERAFTVEETANPGASIFKWEWEKYRGKRIMGTGTPLKVVLGGDDVDNEDNNNNEQGAAKCFDDMRSDDGSTRMIWGVKPYVPDPVAELVELVKSGIYFSQDELAEAQGVDKSTISKRKKRAIHLKKITEEEWKQYLTEQNEDKKDEF